MRYGIFSDILSNFEALFSVLEDLKKEKIDFYLCGGDIVGYGANPNECVECLRNLKIKSIVGNHDLAAINQLDTTCFNPIAKEAILWTGQQLKEENKRYLKRLPVIYNNKDLILVHGSLPSPELFQYLGDIERVNEMFQCLSQNVCFVGHTHIPRYFHHKRKNVAYGALTSIVLNKEDQYIINVGSVGQPRDGDPRAAYCIYDTKLNKIYLKRIVYPIKNSQKKISEEGLPSSLATRLDLGI